jgi:hypothetical protein
VGGFVVEGREGLLEDEVVSITRRRCEHDDDGDEPVLEETGERSVEGVV